MLEEWEQRELASIEGTLRSDSDLARILAPPRPLERHWLMFRRRFYPHGFLLCSVGYMLLGLDGALVGLVIQAVLVGIAGGLVIALSVAGGWRYLHDVAVTFWDR
jgi:hypothetical protein